MNQANTGSGCTIHKSTGFGFGRYAGKGQISLEVQ